MERSLYSLAYMKIDITMGHCLYITPTPHPLPEAVEGLMEESGQVRRARGAEQIQLAGLMCSHTECPLSCDIHT